MKRWILGFSAAVVGCWAATGQSVANASESWPSRPIKWVVPYPPGGTTDIRLSYRIKSLIRQTVRW